MRELDLLSWSFASDESFRDVPTMDMEREIQYLQNFGVIKDTISIQCVSLLPEIKGPVLIIDKSMASTKYFEQLPALKNYKGTIICCDRALYSIIPYRVPEYVVNVDASPLCMSFFDRPDVKAIMPKTAAIFSVTTNPLTVRLWHGARYFFTPSIHRVLAKSLAVESKTAIMQTGGQVASTAYVLACNLGAKVIGLFGITHAYDDMRETEYPNFKQYHTRVKGPYGVCWQDPVYERYNQEYLELINLAKQQHIVSVNTSKSGLLYSKDIVDMSLEEFVSKHKRIY